jgi:hypothetical protein
MAMDETAELSLRALMYKALAQYIAPKRKAVEMAGKDGSPLPHEMTAVNEPIAKIQSKPFIPPSQRKRV